MAGKALKASGKRVMKGNENVYFMNHVTGMICSGPLLMDADIQL